MFSHLRRSDYVSMPWRNGSGSTLEIMREPAAPAAFGWRLSLATIAASGPFSSYPGYRRSVTLIDGAGFQLDVEGQSPAQLTTRGESLLFPGAAATDCALIHGPSTDLSLMVGEPGEIGAVTMECCEPERTYAPSPDAMQAFFCLDDSALFTLDQASVSLTRHDTIVLNAGAAACTIRSARSAAWLLRLSWRLK
jgi:environmental stress-induced protein Ves